MENGEAMVGDHFDLNGVGGGFGGCRGRLDGCGIGSGCGGSLTDDGGVSEGDGVVEWVGVGVSGGSDDGGRDQRGGVGDGDGGGHMTHNGRQCSVRVALDAGVGEVSSKTLRLDDSAVQVGCPHECGGRSQDSSTSDAHEGKADHGQVLMKGKDIIVTITEVNNPTQPQHPTPPPPPPPPSVLPSLPPNHWTSPTNPLPFLSCILPPDTLTITPPPRLWNSPTRPPPLMRRARSRHKDGSDTEEGMEFELKAEKRKSFLCLRVTR
ncbi:hypothetical protein J437_LFUL016922 [Ladona fulva]|uniref:Uncharacterized protein n=1 Tax=Ladona fulva TaxID=123851 RepID=A0A8K0KP88_LADFU|nr:hypothetical protein J437_LFUL016922 [Ladona fulva]